MASLDKAVMNKQYQRVLVTTPHPLLRLVCLGLVTFIFTLFSLELTRFGTLLAPLWFPTAIMMVAFYRHAGKMWPGIATGLFVRQYSGLMDAVLTGFGQPHLPYGQRH